MAGANCDVAIVGAGLAGAAAAERLSGNGLKLAVIEARSRTGGRGHARPFTGGPDILDFGGSWITPWQARIRALCRHHGIALRPRHPVTARRWYRDGRLHHDTPVAAIDRARHESVLARMAGHSALLKAGQTRDHHGFDFTSLTLAAYLDCLAPPAATRDLISAWWTVSGNGDKARVPASEFLHSISYHDGTPDGMCEVWADTLEGGVEELTRRMIAASGASVLSEATVTRIAWRKGGVRLDLANGKSMTANAAIIAAGLNPMAEIAFDPPLPSVKADARAAGHLGRAVKMWIKAEGVEPGILATGGGRAIEWMFAERRAKDGATLLVGFGVADGNWQPALPRDAEEALARFFPEARFIAADWHDWNSDPFARGTWVASIAGKPEAHAASTWRAEGPLAFASSDFARAEAGWFEAAAISGEDAADAIRDHLKAP